MKEFCLLGDIKTETQNVLYSSVITFELKSSAKSFSAIIVIFVFSKDLSYIPSSKPRFCSASMYWTGWIQLRGKM